MTMSALTITALYVHLFVAGLCVRAASVEADAPTATHVSRVTASPQQDALVARSHSAPLSLHQNARRADGFAAVLTNPSTHLTFARTRARTAHPPTPSPSASLLPAASRAPPPLVA